MQDCAKSGRHSLNSNYEQSNCPDCQSNGEYVTTLQGALKEILDKNEALRTRVVEIEALISQAEDELEVKEELIKELQSLIRARKLNKHKKKFFEDQLGRSSRG
jgi:hypothetical protein